MQYQIQIEGLVLHGLACFLSLGAEGQQIKPHAPFIILLISNFPFFILLI